MIGGSLKGRKINANSNLWCRPTSNRLRETLFNWLQFEIQDMICLDMFAGSGALGFEALSRGAKTCTFLDQSGDSIRAIKSQAEIFNLENVVSFQSSFPQNMPKDKMDCYDCVFLDPPFDYACHVDCIEWLIRENKIKASTLIYCESPKTNRPVFPANWQVRQETKVGNVWAGIIEQTA